ncbi:MAG: ribonuclease III [Eubacteriaceae bacterium]|nr:ribonuclease III [Eubacteriaceae bacterium]
MDRLQDRIGYCFKDMSLLETSLTHSSAVNEFKKESNQRLEFLGDAVMQLAVSSFIFLNLPELDEGALSKTRSLIVCADSLFIAAKKIGLHDFLILGKGEEMSGGRNKKNIVADALESLIGAVFLDGGYEAAEKFLLSALSDVIRMALAGELTYDYKTTLQELAQSLDVGKLSYELLGVNGPEHDQVFCSRAVLGKRVFGEANGHSRKQSEQNAAENALKELGIWRVGL